MPPPTLTIRRSLVDPDLDLTAGDTREAQSGVEPWLDAEGRQVFPLPLPELTCDPDVFVPTQGSYLMWKHIYNEGIGRDQRCLDMGCGTGILSVQLALNGAQHVTALDIQEEAVANTLTNAFRNRVADNISGAVTEYTLSSLRKSMTSSWLACIRYRPIH